MFHRLINALRYLFTGHIPAQNPAHAPMARPPVADVTIYEPSNALILRDNVVTAKGKEIIEVRADGIHILAQDGSTSQFVGLSAGADGLSEVDEQIRLHLTRKLSILLPELSNSLKSELLHHVFGVLTLMANDQQSRVRQIIAEELGDLYNAPVELVKKLAWDGSLEVSTPILEFSPLLSDRELMDIITESQIPGVSEAISRRKEVSEDVAGALVDYVTRDTIDASGERVISNLLENPNAHLNENTLQVIAEHAEDHEVWHTPLLSQPNLTIRTINAIARFVSHSLIADMESRRMISKEMGENLSKAVTYRLQNPHYDREKEAEKLAEDLLSQGLLDAEYVAESLEAGEKELVAAALYLLSGLPKHIVKKILGADDAKAVTALVWKANMPMRSAIQVQLKLAKIHYTKILYAKNGKDFPLSEDEMRRIIWEYAQAAA